MKLSSRTAIVTGAGRNIGEGIARAFAEEGASVAVVDIAGDRAQTVAESINSGGGTAFAVTCDVTSSADVQRMVDAVVERWGRIDILVNNVGVVDRKPVLEATEADWDRVIAITLKSVFLVTKAVARHMVDGGHPGWIVNVASTSGHRGRADAVAYPAAKGGVLNLTRSLAIQLAPHNIRVNSITPNRVATEVGPGEVPRAWTVTNLIGRQGRPSDIARGAVFLVSDDADFITGIDLPVVGGVGVGL